MSTFRLIWAPEGRTLCIVDAKDAKAARRKAPLPYRKALGEIHVDELLVKRHTRIYTVAWWSDGRCIVTSQVNGAHVATWDHGAWYGAHNNGMEVPTDVADAAMACRPEAL